MTRMLWAALTFAVGVLVLAIVLWLCQLIIGMLLLPPQIAQIALIVLGLAGLILLVLLVVQTYRGGPPGPPL